MNFLDVLTVAGTAALPVFEVKAATIAGKIAGLPMWETYFLAQLGAILPVPFLLLFFPMLLKWMKRIPIFARLANWLERRVMNKSTKVERFKLFGLFLFVAIPLPTTGVWTGSMIATLLGMKRWPSFFAILLGNMVAGAIMLLLTYTY